MTQTLMKRPRLARVISGINSVITKTIYCAYPCLLVWLLLHEQPHETLAEWLHAPLLVAFALPLASFIALTLLRVLINAPRPYEVFNAAPVIPKKTKGKSFPSRHVFSIFVIGTTFLAVAPTPLFGIIILLLGFGLAIVRVYTGLHFPRDVIAGALLGIAAGSLAFALV